jgi:hypothetical protein
VYHTTNSSARQQFTEFPRRFAICSRQARHRRYVITFASREHDGNHEIVFISLASVTLIDSCFVMPLLTRIKHQIQNYALLISAGSAMGREVDMLTPQSLLE